MGTRQKQLRTITRTLTLKRAAIDQEARTVDLAFSSEEPVEQYFGREILSHDAAAVRLGRLNSGAPLLVNHDPDDQVGLVGSALIDGDRMGRAKVRFGRSERASEVFDDVVDEIRVNVSVGYRVHRMIEEEPGTYRVTDWEPLEISIVSIPADASVGVGRSESETYPVEIEAMPEENRSNENQAGNKPAPAAPVAAPPAAPPVDVQAIETEARKAEQARIRELRELAKLRHAEELANQFIDNGRSVEEFRAAYMAKLPELEKRNDGNDSVDPASIGMSEREVNRYSFVRAIRAMQDPSNAKLAKDAAFEYECSEAAGGDRFRVPVDVLLQPTPIGAYKREMSWRGQTGQRVLTQGGAGTGAELVGEDTLGASFIDLYRNNMEIMALGATMLTGLVGDVAIPKKTSGGTAYWLATDTTDITGSTPGTGQVTLAPKNVAGLIDYSRQLMMQSSIDVEQMVRNDLAETLALAIDVAAIKGTGGAQPQGIVGGTGVLTSSFAAANPTWAEVVALESAVGAANSLRNSPAYLTEFGHKGTAKTTVKDAGSGRFIWEGDEVNGYPAFATTQMTGDANWLFGDFSQLIVGMWGGLDILVDPYSLSASRQTRVTAIQTVDIALRQPTAFVVGSGP